MSPLGWIGIVRLGLVQMALGSIVVLTTSTLNRVMVVELALAATIPGVLVSCYQAVQVMRPRLGYGSDRADRRTPWILGGVAVLGAGGVTAAIATAWMATSFLAGFTLGVIAFVAIGLGIGSAGTSLFALLAQRVDAAKRPVAATIVWVMMMGGFALTATIAGHLLDPFSTTRLVMVMTGIACFAFVLAAVALWNVEGRSAPATVAVTAQRPGTTAFRHALREVWREAQARRFTIFVFVSMFAFAAQDLILEPFAGIVFGLTPGETTRLSGLQNAGVMTGMIAVALAGGVSRRRFSLRATIVAGCLVASLAVAALAAAPSIGAAFPLRAVVFMLGLATGSFAVGAIASMMMLAGEGRESREGLRMGLWGAAQAIAFAIGGFSGTVAVDVVRWAVGAPVLAYSAVFAAEAVVFVVSATLALAAVHRVPSAPAASAT